MPPPSEYEQMEAGVPVTHWFCGRCRLHGWTTLGVIDTLEAHAREAGHP